MSMITAAGFASKDECDRMVVWPRFEDLLRAYHRMSQDKWARVESSVNLGAQGILTHILCRSTWRRQPSPDPARHTLQKRSAPHCGSWSTTPSAGAVKLGLKNCEGHSKLTYVVEEPRDYWAERGYSRYDESKTPAYRTAIYGPVHRETI